MPGRIPPTSSAAQVKQLLVGRRTARRDRKGPTNRHWSRPAKQFGRRHAVRTTSLTTDQRQPRDNRRYAGDRRPITTACGVGDISSFQPVARGRTNRCEPGWRPASRSASCLLEVCRIVGVRSAPARVCRQHHELPARPRSGWPSPTPSVSYQRSPEQSAVRSG